jgi:hypothetical protein
MHRDKIPQEKDWDWSDNPPPDTGWDDAELGHDKFIGKSIEDMLPYFQTCPLSVYEFLSFMPTIPFRYYIMAFKLLFLSEEHLEDLKNDIEPPCLVAHCFLQLVEDKLRESPKLIVPHHGRAYAGRRICGFQPGLLRSRRV